MSAALDTVAWIVTVPVVIVLLVFTFELVAGLLPTRRSPGKPLNAKICVLIPANDEAAGIAAAIDGLIAAVPAGLEILVVADNCTDQTAAIARSRGAIVIERCDAMARGKGFALAFGRDYLAKRPEGPPDLLVVFDADCKMHPGSIQALAEKALTTGSPVQAVNLISADLGAPPMVQISNFAMVVKNLYRSRGMQRLGGAALLTGTGMAFPWKVIEDAPLATGALAEDLELCIALVRAGRPPRLVANAAVFSGPASMKDALIQRTRWEHGFLNSVRRNVLPLLLGGLLRLSRVEFQLGLHLLVPPLALVVLLTIPVILANVALYSLGGTAWPMWASLIAFILMGVAVFAAWMNQGRRYLSPSTLLRMPLYVLWKLPIYVRLLRKPEREWRRSDRAGPEVPADVAAKDAPGRLPAASAKLTPGRRS